jgi:hypothetical protein
MKLLSPTAMQSLGWALLHFLWQGTALAALGAALMAFSRRARVRYVIGVAVLLLMLLAPIATCVLSWQPHSSFAERSQPVASAWTKANAKHQAIPSVASSSVESSLDAFPWLVEAWLLGVAFFSLRSAGGFLLLERERRKQPQWLRTDCSRSATDCRISWALLARSATASALGCRLLR